MLLQEVHPARLAHHVREEASQRRPRRRAQHQQNQVGMLRRKQHDHDVRHSRNRQGNERRVHDRDQEESQNAKVLEKMQKARSRKEAQNACGLVWEMHLVGWTRAKQARTQKSRNESQ